jgi:hypothetical protein
LVFGKEECFFYNSFFLKDYFNWCFSSTRFSKTVSRKVLDYLNVRYVLGPHHFDRFHWLSPTSLSENLSPLPKWNGVSRAYLQADWISDMERIGGQDFRFNRQCFAEDAALAGTYSPRKVREMSRRPGRVVLKAEGSGRGLLVSSEMAYPGWRAEAGGKEIPLLRVNHGFRGIALSEGQQEVELVYKPVSFQLGCFLSLLSVGIWFGMLFQCFMPRPDFKDIRQN